MSTAVYGIAGGDYARAGSAASGLKELLKRIGVGPEAVRRAMIAAYEAEMNVVIHAHRGRMQVTLDPDQIDVEVTDEGPGIPDIELAMTEGYSTAPAAARELGFGAGMGLPNIKRNSDRFAIDSTVGQGTRVAFTIHHKPQTGVAWGRNSLRVTGELCCGCLQCLRACPTRALRVRGSKPMVLEHLCFDCTACIAACERGALAMEGAGEAPRAAASAVLVLPTPFLAQFGAGIGAGDVLDALAKVGFRNVLATQGWEAALRRAVAEYARQEARPAPVLSPVCPAVVNLIELQFPSLLKHVAPFLSPMEAVQEELAGREAVFVALCPAQRTVLTSRRGSAGRSVVAPSGLRQMVMPLLAAGGREAHELPASDAAETGGILRVTGIRHAIRVLEQAENGFLSDVQVLELFACDQGCFGSPLLSQEGSLSRYRARRLAARLGDAARAVGRTAPLAARPGLRLDPDMAKAIEKLARMEEALRGLGGKDCGRCGAPACTATAEDIVLGRVSDTACVHRSARQEGTK